ncbi:hypothetical protein [Peloplasma aerotolerans]|uniref:6-bladed beta-propeller n=1 Tax=Peloplasma aerotolerans TaxID=3044389 RepID=A0AAW6U8Z5_9MOLU|nr:hypothetical protein [Mariniplasma sp. M4Ah]MDI6452434.1 hypothetical protein [Mariniplasma sp. M4Ah]
MKKLLILSLLMALIFSCFSIITVKGMSYNYDYFGKAVHAPAAYSYKTEINSHSANISSFVRLADVEVHNDKIYVLDEAIGLYVFDSDMNFLYHFQSFINENETTDRLRRSTSIAVTDEYIYVADTDTERIAILSHYDENGQDLHNIRYVKSIYMPEDIPSMQNIAFKPLKIDVDRSGRIFVINRDVYEGLMEFDFDGNFKQFYGTNEVEINLIDYFWRQVISDEARSRLQLYLPVVFTALAIDSSGFVYTTTESANVNPIQKFNYKGEDILIQNGNIPVIGDVSSEPDNKSTFRAIDINDYGIYIALDRTMNRIFSYNDNGELLYIIGNRGSTIGTFEVPSSIKWFGDNILILDQSLGKVFIFEPTEYGNNINQAVYHYYHGDFETSKDYWEEVLKLNTNYDLAYVGIGKVFYQNEQYQEAVEFFRLGNNRVYYSRAYEKYRNEWLRSNFTWLFLGAVVLIGTAGYSLRRKPE